MINQFPFHIFEFRWLFPDPLIVHGLSGNSPLCTRKQKTQTAFFSLIQLPSALINRTRYEYRVRLHFWLRVTPGDRNISPVFAGMLNKFKIIPVGKKATGRRSVLPEWMFSGGNFPPSPSNLTAPDTAPGNENRCAGAAIRAPPPQPDRVNFTWDILKVT